MASTGVESTGLNLWIRERRFAKRMRRANAEYESFVVSLPKAGRTWHRLMLGHYLARSVGQDPKRSLKLDFLCEMNRIPLLRYSHNYTSFSDKLPPTSDVVASPLEWKNKNVLLLVRNLRDVLVSGYFHCRYREKSFPGTISEYVRNPFVGIEKLLTAHNRWHENRHLAKTFDVLSYEAMHSDTETALRRTLAFAGVQAPSNERTKEAVEFTELKNLQKLEESDFFRSVEMRNTYNDPRARKIRSGKVGGYSEHLSADDLEYIAEKERRMPNPFAI